MPRLAASGRLTSSWVLGKGKLQLEGFLSLAFLGEVSRSCPFAALQPRVPKSTTAG